MAGKLRRLWHRQMMALKPLFTLVSGTAVSQIITSLSLLGLARIYSPAEFGVLGVFNAIFLSVAVVACLRLDIAIALPENEGEATALLICSVIAALFVALGAAVVIFIVIEVNAVGSLVDRVGLNIWFLPVALFFSGLTSSLQNWMIRKRRYSKIAKTKIAQSAGGAATQICAGLAGAGPLGLIIGVLANQVSGAIVVSRAAYQDIWHDGQLRMIVKLRDVLIRYRKYPLFSTWEALANSFASQLPIILVSSVVSNSEVGHLMMALNVVQAPIALFGSSVGQIYLSRAAERHRAGMLSNFTKRIMVRLFLCALMMFGALALLAPWGSVYLLGEEWKRSGELVLWFAPSLIFQFTYAPISMIFHVLGRQKLALVVQMSGLVVRLGGTWIGAEYLPEKISEFYAISGAIFYGSALLIILSLVHSQTSEGLEH